MKKDAQDSPIKTKLFQLAERVLDDALLDSASQETRLESLKQVASLYIGNIRATKNILIDDDDEMTMDKLRSRIANGELQ